MVNNIYQARYYMQKLSHSKHLANLEKFVPAIMQSGIEIFPHQIEASLSALDNPFRKGFVLCDEVGLGKGIEAMLVIAQKYYENKKIVVIVPVNLLDQWQDMIVNKFNLNYIIQKVNNEQNFENYITLVSIQYAFENEEIIKDANYDLAVFEEAHHLRNFYTNESKTSTTLYNIFKDTKKLLLTATPMQKNVMDIYGLMKFIDEDMFGDADDFYKRYYKKPENYEELKEILSPYMFRTLRSQVQIDVKLPKRKILTQEYSLENEKEQELNKLLMKYIEKPTKLAFPSMDTYELSLMLEKTFSSSIYALSKTLAGVYDRLSKMDDIKAHEEALQIKEMLEIATSLTDTSKGKVFLIAVAQAMKSLKENKHPQKIVIFTENRESQKYIAQILESNTNFKLSIYNGSTGNKPLEDFKNTTQILITTDNANEGFNFEFCNCVINLDNPWNILSIEQRIGRCHRIGQQNDVLVVNFLCKELFADVRFMELAYKRINMFDGILGTSDNIISQTENGNIARQVAGFVTSLRGKEDVEKQFETLRNEYKDIADENENQANSQLFKTFDNSIVEKTKNYVKLIQKQIEETKDLLWDLTLFELKNEAIFETGLRSFRIDRSYYAKHLRGYIDCVLDFTKNTPKQSRYYKYHPVAKEVHRRVMGDFLDSGKFGKLVLENKNNDINFKSGFIQVYSIDVHDLDQSTIYSPMLILGYDKAGNTISFEIIEKILNLPAIENNEKDLPNDVLQKFKTEKEFVLPTKLEEFKNECKYMSDLGINNIKRSYEYQKYKLQDNIEVLEREMNKNKNKSLTPRKEDEFLLNQKVADLSSQLLKAKETLFLSKLKLKKEEEQKVKEYIEKCKFWIKDKMLFTIEFEIKQLP